VKTGLEFPLPSSTCQNQSRMHTTSPPPKPPPRLLRLIAVAALFPWLLCLSAYAQTITDPTPLVFQTPHQEQRFHALVSELRCVQCQNQSLADSNAQIAQDLRREVLGLMQQGRSDGEIKAFLVQRYGEFVLYRPPFAAHTWLLWLAPALVAVAGALVIIRVTRHRARALGAAEGFPDDEIEGIEQIGQIRDSEEIEYAKER